jgi:hypothetical protein
MDDSLVDDSLADGAVADVSILDGDCPSARDTDEEMIRTIVISRIQASVQFRWIDMLHHLP